MEATTVVETGPVRPAAGEPDLKHGAIGFLSNLVIGTASVAPAYSLAATLGFVVAVGGIGVFSPGAMIAAFVPMLLIAMAYRQLNKADPDAGTSFAWGTRALGPYVGWMNGWAIFAADVIVMASLADIAAVYTYQLFGWNYGETHLWVQIVGAVVWIVLMTWICWRGIELSARVQQLLLSYEIIMLLVFAAVAFAKVAAGSAPHSISFHISWLNPFGGGLTPLVGGVLLAVFIYWGWDSGVSVNEETRNSRTAPGAAAVISTLLLLVIYVVVTSGAQAYAGTTFLVNHPNDVLTPLGKGVLGSVGYRLLVIAILTSAAASTQTTVLPTARTTLSMARWRAIPKKIGEIHPRYLTPTVSTLGMGAISIVWTVLILALDPSGNVLGDAITALGFMICFYYGLTGFACVVYFRKRLFRSVKEFLLVGLCPLVGALMLTAIFVKAFIQDSKSGVNFSPPILGIQTPIFIGIGGLILGVIVMLFFIPSHRAFFRRKPELPGPDGYAIGGTITPEDEEAAVAAGTHSVP
ncbi:MAG: APC family permease [Solirubrobacterales bacterium]|nr:APC family permease [Solirubrobacterales bacterium]MBV9166036.1 APC family permease [Solirubrobacterales bacterium]MBV9536807.1 APC family permease [Solirubrobacterales bacterium]